MSPIHRSSRHAVVALLILLVVALAVYTFAQVGDSDQHTAQGSLPNQQVSVPAPTPPDEIAGQHQPVPVPASAPPDEKSKQHDEKDVEIFHGGDDREELDEQASEKNLPYEDEYNPIPVDGMSKALEHIEHMHISGEMRLSGAGVEPADWQWLGPPDVGGRIYGIVIHPNDPLTMWVTSPSGGIWKTGNGGMSWQPIDDLMASLNISSLVIDQRRPDVLYASTGDLYSVGAGIFRTIDGGKRWQRLSATTPSDNQPQWARVSYLAIAANSHILLASTVVKQTDQSKAGIWRSADDGVSWQQTLSGQGVLQVVFNPVDDRYAVASSFGKAWYSSDGGLTWQESSGLPTSPSAFQNYQYRTELAFAPSDPTIVYAAVDTGGGQLWRSTDAGKTYKLVNNTAYSMTSGLWVDPTNPQVVVVGGIDAWRSTNGGVTFTKITEWTNGKSVHADHRVIVSGPRFDGSSNKTVYFGTDGGLYETEDIYSVQTLQGWRKLNNNLGVTQFYDVCGNSSLKNVAGGTLDNGTVLFVDESKQWKYIAGGDGYVCQMSSDGGFVYGQVQRLNIWRYDINKQKSYNINGKHSYWNGLKWTCEWQPVPYRIPEAVPVDLSCGDVDIFFAPIEIDSNNTDRLLVAGLSVWQTKTANSPIIVSNTAPITVPTGPIWTQIKDPVSTRKIWPAESVYWRQVNAITIAPANPDLVWVGYNDGRLFKTTNGMAEHPVWTSVDAGLPTSDTLSSPSYRQVEQIVISESNTDLVYVVFSGFNRDNIWMTADGGQSWQKIVGTAPSYALPAVPIYTLAVNPQHPSWLYVGTEMGLFTSQDGGQNWFVPQSGPARVRVSKLLWLDTKLVVATYGRGVWITEPDSQETPLVKLYLPMVTH